MRPPFRRESEFNDSPEYDIRWRDFEAILESLPKLDGWKPEIKLWDLDEITQNRLDAQEIGEIECVVSVERQVGEPARLLKEYRFRFNKKRSELIDDYLVDLIDAIDRNLDLPPFSVPLRVRGLGPLYIDYENCPYGFTVLSNGIL